MWTRLRYVFKVEEAAWPGGQRVGLAIQQSRVRVPCALFVLGRPEFKSSARLVNSQLAASCRLGFLYCWFSHDVTKIQTRKDIDPTGMLLSRCIRAAEN